MRTGRAAALFVLLLLTSVGCAQQQRGPVQVDAAQTPIEAVRQPPTALPNRTDSLKFAVLGDFGDGSDEQYALAAEMTRVHQRFPYTFVITVGDNLYGSERPQDFKRKFEVPYKPLLDAGVKFYASLGNHDSREQRFYKLFNMGGKRYYTFTPAPGVRFFALDATAMDNRQMQWLEQALQASNEAWKIAFFHHPLYSSGARPGPDVRLRTALEPLFVEHHVSVVLTGRDHFYERIQPQKGIAYFVAGSGGRLRSGRVDVNSGISAKAFDADQAFLAAEIVGDELFFTAISRQGRAVDAGVLQRRR